MLEDRRRAFEAKFEHDQETEFRIRAHRDKLFGLWVATKLGRTGADAEDYAMRFVAALGPHHDMTVRRQAFEDLQRAGLLLGPEELQAALASAETVAEQEVAARPTRFAGRRPRRSRARAFPPPRRNRLA